MLKADLMDPLRRPLALAGAGPLAVWILCISGETHPAGAAEGKWEEPRVVNLVLLIEYLIQLTRYR